MDIKGKITEVGKTQQVSDSLKKRELIVEYVESNPQYPEYLKFECVQDKCALLDSVKVGDDVEVHFNLRGRPWTDKTGKKSYFNSIQLWRINLLGSQTVNTYTPPSSVEDPDDQLPF